MESLIAILFIPALLLVAVVVIYIVKLVFYDVYISDFSDVWKDYKNKKISFKIMIFLIVLGIFINFILPRL